MSAIRGTVICSAALMLHISYRNYLRSFLSVFRRIDFWHSSEGYLYKPFLLLKNREKKQRISRGKAPKCANFVRTGVKSQLDNITKPSVVLPTNGSVISYSLVRRMRLELTRANAHYPLNCASGFIVTDICEFLQRLSAFSKHSLYQLH